MIDKSPASYPFTKKISRSFVAEGDEIQMLSPNTATVILTVSGDFSGEISVFGYAEDGGVVRFFYGGRR